MLEKLWIIKFIIPPITPLIIYFSLRNVKYFKEKKRIFGFVMAFLTILVVYLCRLLFS